MDKLIIQGAWSRLPLHEEAERKWASIMWSLPSAVAQFASKAALDVLPTRANLCRWKTTCDSACTRCGVKETLHHVLNHCNTLLLAGAYKWRHDSILHQMFREVSRNPRWTSIWVDLPGHTYTLPFTADFAWRPDLVLLDAAHNICFIELTVSFEANIPDAHRRKTTKYGTLVSNAKDVGLLPTLLCVEMGSRGLPGRAWGEWVRTHKIHHKFSSTCSSIAIQASHKIWLNRDTTWPNPPLLALDGLDG